MADSDLASIVTRARSGDPATFSALIAALQRDLRSFLATFAGSRKMLDDCERATWGECRRIIDKCPTSDAAATWMRQLATAQIRPRLEADLRQAVAAKDTLRQLAMQDGLESLRALTGAANADAQHVAARYPTLTEPLQVLIARRYTDRASLAELAKERSIGEADLAIRLFVARASLHPRATATDARPPSDRLLPAQIEQVINGTLPSEMSSALAASLLKDLGRAAAFTRQLRIDLLLETLFGPDQDALALANELIANDKKRRNESSLLQVVAPPRTPVSSGSELMRTGATLAAKQTRPTSDGTRRLARKTEDVQHSKTVSTLKRTSRPVLTADDDDGPPKNNSRKILFIGCALALIGIVGLVVVWNRSGPATTNDIVAGSTPTAASGVIARVFSTSGAAAVLDDGKRSKASEGQALHSGQGVEVGDTGTLVLDLPDLGRLELRSGTQLGALAERGPQHIVHVLLTQGALTATVTGDNRTLVVLTAMGRTELVNGTYQVTATQKSLGVEVNAGAAQLARADGSRSIAISSGKQGTVTELDDPHIDAGSVFLRGINLGGNAVTVDRKLWLSHRQALSAGMTVVAGTDIAPPNSLSAPGLDFDLKSLLDTGLTAVAGPVHVKQKVPNGDYDVSFWLTGPRGVSAEGLTLNRREIPVGQPTSKNENWWRVGPYRVTVTDKVLDVQISCTNATRLSGMALYGHGSPPPLLPVALTVVSPGDSTVFYTSDNVTLRSEALGAKGITVSYFNDDVLLGDSTKGPAYAFTLVSPKPGNYHVTARSTNGGETSVSLPISFVLAQSGGTGTITANRWDGIGGDRLANAAGNPKLADKPNQTRPVSEFEVPSVPGDSYTRICGYLVPPFTGDYVFWIASDDESELLLSSDDQPANKKRIAHCPGPIGARNWAGPPSAQSPAMTLVAGTRYYIEAAEKNGGGPGYCAVGWKLPNGALERPIPGAHLIPYAGP